PTPDAVGTRHGVLEVVPPLVHDDVPVELLGIHAVHAEQEQLVVTPVERCAEFAGIDILRLTGSRRVVDAPVNVERLEIDYGILGEYQQHAAVHGVKYGERRRGAGSGVTRATPPRARNEIPNLSGAAGIEIVAVEYVEGTLLEDYRVGGTRDVVANFHVPGRAAGPLEVRPDPDEHAGIGGCAQFEAAVIIGNGLVQYGAGAGSEKLYGRLPDRLQFQVVVVQAVAIGDRRWRFILRRAAYGDGVAATAAARVTTAVTARGRSCSATPATAAGSERGCAHCGDRKITRQSA